MTQIIPPTSKGLGRNCGISSDDLWGIERKSDTPERLIFIYEALVKLNLPPTFSIIDIAAGRGVVINGLSGIFPECKPYIVDIMKYDYDWGKFSRRIKCFVMPVQDFIKRKCGIFDVVMMLNSYRNWSEEVGTSHEIKRGRNDFDEWLIKHAKYFITSGAKLPYEQGEIRGHDFKGVLQLFKLPLSKI